MKEENEEDNGLYAADDVYERTKDFWASSNEDEERSMAVNRLHRGTKE